MITFSPDVHTPEALSLEIGQIHKDNDLTRLAGSLGRAVIFGRILGDPFHEYGERGQNPLVAESVARDIDLITGAPAAAANYEPFHVDTTGFASPFFSIETQDGEWFLVASYHDFAEPLHEDVVCPVQGETVFGIPSVTVPPQTLLALYGNKGQMRPKDIRSQQLLKRARDKLPSDEHLPDELFKPFEDLTLINQASVYIHAQDAYRRMVPLGIRSKLVPIINYAKRLVL